MQLILEDVENAEENAISVSFITKYDQIRIEAAAF
jgi:hypothetical protein